MAPSSPQQTTIKRTIAATAQEVSAKRSKMKSLLVVHEPKEHHENGAVSSSKKNDSDIITDKNVARCAERQRLGDTKTCFACQNVPRENGGTLLRPCECFELDGISGDGVLVCQSCLEKDDAICHVCAKCSHIFCGKSESCTYKTCVCCKSHCCMWCLERAGWKKCGMCKDAVCLDCKPEKLEKGCWCDRYEMICKSYLCQEFFDRCYRCDNKVCINCQVVVDGSKNIRVCQGCSHRFECGDCGDSSESEDQSDDDAAEVNLMAHSTAALGFFTLETWAFYGDQL